MISHQTWRCSLRYHFSLSPLQLTADEIKQFHHLVQAHRTSQSLTRRARIVLTAHTHPDWSSQQLAQSLTLDARLVPKRRRRWQGPHSLKEAPRSASPPRLSPLPRAQVTTFTSILPPSHR